MIVNYPPFRTTVISLLVGFCSLSFMAPTYAASADEWRCKSYARDAVEQNAKNLSAGCGFTGLRWNNDKAAVKAYEDLVQKQPKNADLQEEIANVYYKNGAKEKSVETFFEAGKSFLAGKNIKKAKHIAEILKRISPYKSLPSRTRSPTPANTEYPPCSEATLFISSVMRTVLPTPAPPKSPTLPPFIKGVIRSTALMPVSQSG